MMLEDKEQIIRNMRRRTTRLDREGDYWTAEDNEQLHTMFDDGVGISEMALMLQRSEAAVAQQIEKLDLYERKTNPVRSRKENKPPACLCDHCRVDRALCPHIGDCPLKREV